jgi:hypothetical protein
MSKTIRTKISRGWRTLCFWSVVVGVTCSSFVVVVPPGGVMAGVAEPTCQMEVYYLSPRILTRIAMTPERLETDKSRVDRKILPTPALIKLLREVRSKSHQPTGRSRFAYDFRLCIRADSRSTCFSADGAVGYTSGEPFSLSTDERNDVLSLFQEMDARASHDPRREQ